MHSTTQTLIQLFDGDKRYIIPIYQRQYAWKVDPQWSLLWSDIQGAVERIKADRSTPFKHFMGALVLYELKTHGQQVRSYEVIDGQQRLTTIQIILTALRDEAASIDGRVAMGVEKYLLNDGLMADEEIERYKLWPTITDRASFVTLVDSKADTSGHDFVNSDFQDIKKQTELSYAFFREKMAGFLQSNDAAEQKSKLGLLFEALKDRLAVVSIELDASDDPQTIFETLNSRGESLAEGDLIRNFLFQRALRKNDEDQGLVERLYSKHWLHFDNDLWRTPASQGKTFLPLRDWMIVDHLTMHVGENVTHTRLFSRYRNWIEAKTPFENLEAELISINESAVIYQEVRKADLSTPLGRIGAVITAFDVNTVTPLVLFLAKKISDKDELAVALKWIESFIVRRDICRQTTKNYNNFFVELINDLRDLESDIADALKLKLSEGSKDTNRWPDNETFRDSWLYEQQYRNGRSKRLIFILSQIELLKRAKQSEDIQIKSNLTIEHIMPQKWLKHWGIAEADDEEKIKDRSIHINRMGNLTLLTHSLNSEVSNGSFETKMNAVKNQSALALNRELSLEPPWSEAEIMKRGEELYKFALKIWSS